MLRIRFTRRASRGLARIVEFNASSGTPRSAAIVDLIGSAIRVLADHPFVGRPVDERLRELVISHGKTGYVALYSVDLVRGWVRVLAIRHQREAGFAP